MATTSGDPPASPHTNNAPWDSAAQRPPTGPWPTDAAERLRWVRELCISLSGGLPKAIVAGDRTHVDHLLDGSSRSPLLGPSSLHVAALFGELELAKRLAVGSAVHDLCTIPVDLKRSRDKATPLHFAIGARQVEVIKLLVGRGAKLENEFGGKSSAPPVYLLWDTWLDATGCNEPRDIIRTIDTLLTLGWDINDRLYVSRWTMLHYAAFLSQHRMALRRDVVAFLLTHGATASALTDLSRTPLHCAANSNWTAETVELLLAHSPEIINAVDAGGETALHQAVRNRALNPGVTLEVIRTLCDAGANVGAKNNERLTPVFIAEFYKDDEAAALMMRYWRDDQSMTSTRRWSIGDNPQRQRKSGALSGPPRSSRTMSLPLLSLRRKSTGSDRRKLLDGSAAASSERLEPLVE